MSVCYHLTVHQSKLEASHCISTPCISGLSGDKWALWGSTTWSLEVRYRQAAPIWQHKGKYRSLKETNKLLHFPSPFLICMVLFPSMVKKTIHKVINHRHEQVTWFSSPVRLSRADEALEEPMFKKDPVGTSQLTIFPQDMRTRSSL